MTGLLRGKIFYLLLLLTSLASLANAKNLAQTSEDAAKKWADSIYTKKETFSESVLSASEKYGAYRNEMMKALDNAGVKVSQMWHYVGMTAPSTKPLTDIYYSMREYKRPAESFKIVDLRETPFDENVEFKGRKLWEKTQMQFGVVQDIDSFSAFSGTTTFLRTSISAKKAISISASFAVSENYQVWLNGKKIAEDKEKNLGTHGIKFITLDLKEGENELFFVVNRSAEECIMRALFSPYADAAKLVAEKISADFPLESKALEVWSEFCNRPALASLVSSGCKASLTFSAIENGLERSLFSAGKFEAIYEKLKQENASAKEYLNLLSDIISARAVEWRLGYDIKNVRASMEFTAKKFPEYPKKYFEELEKFERKWEEIKSGLSSKNATQKNAAIASAEEFKNFARRALLANPMLEKYSKWACVKRSSKTFEKGLPFNWQGNTSLVKESKKRPLYETYDDELLEFDIRHPMQSKVIFKSKDHPAISDLDVNFDGKKILFSTLDKKNAWHICEISSDGKNLRDISPRIHEGVDAYNGIYLPDGKIIFCYTACHVGVPCVNGVDYVANLYLMNPNAGSPEKVDESIRQLTFEQDADWMPHVMENGRVMYTRWEYTDNSHYFSRILMHMNPDGTSQSALYGSNSYWPNALFYCKQIPGDSNKFVGIVSGHHGVRRMGELHLFDISKGTKDDKGRVHRYPSFGRKYKAKVMDKLVEDSFPKIIHPFPLSENFIVASMQSAVGDFGITRIAKDLNTSRRDNEGKWGIYLIDSFDNFTPVLEAEDDSMMFEPVPLAERKVPETVADKTDPDIDYGYVFLNDIYKGEGLANVPRGTVKALRIIEYFYCYRNTGFNYIIGNEGPWDVKIVHGTVPVEEDGSAMFQVPANRPIAVQPLDSEGRALALMRSWFTVMPGETQSCVGCHETQLMTPSLAPSLASRRAPSKISPFRNAPPRGFSYDRELQPILDKRCSGCHDGSKKGRPNFARGEKVWHKFPSSYLSLHPYVRRPGPESNQEMLSPLEFHASTSPLVQLLEKGHKGVEMTKEEMEVLYTWIDLNVPFYGTWKETVDKIPNNGDVERKKFLAKYANRHDDPDKIFFDPGKQSFEKPKTCEKHTKQNLSAKNFPFGESAAKEKIDAQKLPKEILLNLGNGTQMRFTLVPAGEFVMGSDGGFFDEGPARVVKIDKPFYTAVCEVSNAQYAAFDKNHDSGHFDRQWRDHINRGYPANEPEQSAVRVSWNDASQFCAWMSKKFGIKATLPSEEQWEWAARAGSSDDFWFGKTGCDFSKFENFADKQTLKFAVDGVNPRPLVNPDSFIAWHPADLNFDDGYLVTAPTGSYRANAFGLFDMQGNVCEWTASDHTKTLGGEPSGKGKVVRGGSWYDEPKMSRLTMRRAYWPWQKVYNVGFRVVIEDAEKVAQALSKKFDNK